VSDEPPRPHRRRPRYAGKHPRRFAEKYKELAPDQYPDIAARVLASGKTPAGSHVPIMVAEVLGALAPRPGEVVVDCTLGHGGHATSLLHAVRPGGLLIGLDVDPVELPKTEARLRGLGFGAEVFRAHRSNFAGLPQALAAEGLPGADAVLADLGLSSMQLDDPRRGFTMKTAGPLDMRMNPSRGQPASAWLSTVGPARLAGVLEECADEPHAALLAAALAGRHFDLTTQLADAVRAALSHLPAGEAESSVRRVFQAVRIAVNEELTALEMLLRVLPASLNPGGRAAILTFHSGEDRRVKKAFQAGLGDGLYEAVAEEVVRPSADECRDNPRARPAKLRWARTAAAGRLRATARINEK
jgi:16S rRNA (cytosine1402-N4)-methyltransferase